VRADPNKLARMLRNAFVLLAAVGLCGVLGWSLWSPAAPDAPDPLPEPVAVAADPEPAQPPPLRTEQVEVGRRDTVSAALRRHRVPDATAHEITRALSDAGVDMRRVRPGDILELSRDAGDSVVAVGYAPSPWTRFEAHAGAGGWQGTRHEREPELRLEVRQGAIESSLWDAVQAGALTPAMLLELVQIFESEFDFSVDARPGDRFRLLVRTRSADGVFVDHDRIVAAQYISDGRALTGIGFEVGDRFGYYDGDGRSLRKTFLRSPLQFTRISSGFTHRRPHPILGGVRPHLAIDYAAPSGTPVWAVADGTVRFAGRNGGNGIQVRLRHRAGYETYYNHLSRVGAGIRRGAGVTQKQVIGYVGSTGLSTGPHLDYRVARHGRFVNPLSEKFLPGEPVPASQKARFLEHAARLLRELQADPEPGA
jgi:murein DD-endopeptidase MepM/ murein hydrolase activator NlpD